MKERLLFGAILLSVLFFSAACDSDDAECVDDGDCESGEVCNSGFCESETAGNRDTGRPRDVEGVDVSDSGTVDTQPDTVVTDTSADPGEDADGGGGAETTPEVTVDESLDIAGLLSPECETFCTALCDFLWECGKEDTTCLTRCAESPRYQQLSAAACTEGSHVIGMEDCALWMDCGGVECGIDEMCLNLVVMYECAPICDLTQSEPACTGSDTCRAVGDASGTEMTALGMCFGFF